MAKAKGKIGGKKKGSTIHGAMDTGTLGGTKK